MYIVFCLVSSSVATLTYPDCPSLTNFTVVTCTIHPSSNANVCEVIAIPNDDSQATIAGM